jgi:hypothetical protein
MNKWKISFWISIIILVTVSIYCFFTVIDRSVTIAFMKIGYAQTESDLTTIANIYNETDLSKNQIQNEIQKNSMYESLDFKKDTFELQKVNLIFEKERLIKIEPNY